MNKTILITGGAGFIGSHVVRLFVNKYPDYKIVNLDVLTYAGNLENLLIYLPVCYKVRNLIIYWIEKSVNKYFFS